MEKLFDLLLILFIIYAFLAPFLKKKPVPKRKPTEIPTQRRESDFEEETEVVQSESQQDILSEIEELFGVPKEKPEEKEEEIFFKDEEKQISQDQVSFDTKLIKRDEFQIPVSKPKVSEIELSEYRIEQFDYDEKIEEYEIEQFDYSKTFETPEIEEKIPIFSFSISEPNDFKRAIIYKEIFDTPLALRIRRIKWQRNIY